MNKDTITFNIENFDELFTGDPVEIEEKLSALLPDAEGRADKSIYVQILSQIALAQAMQKNFDLAHKTLDKAEAELREGHELARVRVLLERGRIYHQADKIGVALPLFIQSYELSAKHGFDFHTVNAAHMIAIIESKVENKIQWNKKAIDLAKNTNDKRCQEWLGPLYNNLAQNYIEAEQYAEALSSFEECKKYAEGKGDEIVMRGAKWGIARSLRSLGLLDDALEIQHALLEEYENVELPLELLVVSRGVVYEELAEIYLSLSKKNAELCYKDLSQDQWVHRMMPERLERMRKLKNFEK